jgi:hypothetical protein
VITTARGVNFINASFWSAITYDRSGDPQMTPAAQRTLDRAFGPLPILYEPPEACRVIYVAYPDEDQDWREQ